SCECCYCQLRVFMVCDFVIGLFRKRHEVTLSYGKQNSGYHPSTVQTGFTVEPGVFEQVWLQKPSVSATNTVLIRSSLKRRDSVTLNLGVLNRSSLKSIGSVTLNLVCSNRVWFSGMSP